MDELLAKLQKDFPDLRFVQGRKFAFRPPRTVVMGAEAPVRATSETAEGATEAVAAVVTEAGTDAAAELLLLHEVGHAVLGHYDFKLDVERLKMELAAWEKARELAKIYGVEFDDEVMEAELDTYRDWLHQKSRCPKCGLTRYQTAEGAYHCPRCESIS